MRHVASSHEAVGEQDTTGLENVEGMLESKSARFVVVWNMTSIHTHVDQGISAWVTCGRRTMFVSNSAVLREHITL